MQNENLLKIMHPHFIFIIVYEIYEHTGSLSEA